MGGQRQATVLTGRGMWLILELCGAQVSECRVQSAGVVDLLDESGQVGADVLERLVVRQVHGLDLEGLDETLRLGVVVRIAASAHRPDEPMLGEQPRDSAE